MSSDSYRIRPVLMTETIVRIKSESAIMPDQLSVEGELNLTIVTILLDKHNERIVSFVTDIPYRVAVVRTLLIIRMWTKGQISKEDSIRQIVSAIQHFPVFGDAEEVRGYVDCLDGHHIHVDYARDEVIIGRNKHRDTWGRVAFGNHTEHINWDSPNGAAELADPDAYHKFA